MIAPCSSRTSWIVSAETGPACSATGCSIAEWLNWYWVTRKPPITLVKAAGKTSITSLLRKRRCKDASCGKTPVLTIPLCCITRLHDPDEFFKRPVEFQTCVLGIRWSTKRNFWGNHQIFHAPGRLSAEAADGPGGNHACQ